MSSSQQETKSLPARAATAFAMRTMRVPPEQMIHLSALVDKPRQKNSPSSCVRYLLDGTTIAAAATLGDYVNVVRRGLGV